MKDRNGFTLVELSIVLVIIGLLIGGILVAQSMVGTAKIQSTIRQVGQFDAAVENFVTKYQQLPGDTNLMGYCLGNNDKLISSQYAYSNCPGLPTNESFKFWSDLNISGFLSANGSNYVDDSSGTNSGLNNSNYYPQSAAGDSAFVIPLGADVPGYNYYFFVSLPAGSWYTGAAAFKPAEVLSIDEKIDDGKANSGNVEGGIEAATSLFPVASPNAAVASTTTCANGATYQSATTTDTCGIRIRIGTVSGSLH